MAWHAARMDHTATTARKFDWMLLAASLAFTGGGLYLALVGFGLTAPPSRINGPNWLAVAAGLVFFSAGASLLVRVWLRVPDNQPNLPDDAPKFAVAIQWLAMLTIIGGLASIATWIAFGAGMRHFDMSVPVPVSWAETAGRTAFGIGAVITWLMAALVAYAGVMKMLGKKP
jgi:hypothetical protein